jgi:hypothetical protein
VRHRVGQGLAKRLLREVGDLGSEEVDDLGRAIAGAELVRDRLEAPQERQAVDLVLADLVTLDDLPGDLVGG